MLNANYTVGGTVDDTRGSLNLIYSEIPIEEWENMDTSIFNKAVGDATEQLRRRFAIETEHLPDVYKAYQSMVQDAGNRARRKIVETPNNDVNWYIRELQFFKICSRDKRDKVIWGIVRSASLTLDKLTNANVTTEARIRMKSSRKPLVTASIIF